MEEDGPDLAALGREFLTSLNALGKDFKQAFEQQAEEAQYRLDKLFAKELAKHPELYAELRRGARKARKTWDDVSRQLGL